VPKGLERLSDIALVTQVTVFGNRRAFDQLVRKYQSPVRRFLLNLTLGNEVLSDDLAQDTFLKAYTHIGQFRALSSFQTWLFRVAYRVFYDYHRSASHSPATALLEPGKSTDRSVIDQATCNENSCNSPQLRMDIYQALSLLKDDERTCITLQLIDGESIDHIAEITGIAPNTVKSHLKRGKDKLANFLRRNGYER